MPPGLAHRIRSTRDGRRAAQATVGAAACLLLAGCVAGGAAALGTVVAGARMASEPDYAPLAREVTDRVTFHRPAPQVYEALIATVERNDRRIVGSEPDAYLLRVSYPFSMQTNHWGGVLTLSCVPEGTSTALVIVGSGRDGTARLRQIGDEIVSDLGAALERTPYAP